MFEVGREEVRVRLKGSTLGKEVGKIEVEISKVRRVFLFFLLSSFDARQSLTLSLFRHLHQLPVLDVVPYP